MNISKVISKHRPNDIVMTWIKFTNMKDILVIFIRICYSFYLTLLIWLQSEGAYSVMQRTRKISVTSLNLQKAKYNKTKTWTDKFILKKTFLQHLTSCRAWIIPIT